MKVWHYVGQLSPLVHGLIEQWYFSKLLFISTLLNISLFPLILLTLEGIR